eukprot:8368063-Pyramimonas_sp.AAC.1
MAASTEYLPPPLAAKKMKIAPYRAAVSKVYCNDGKSATHSTFKTHLQLVRVLPHAQVWPQRCVADTYSAANLHFRKWRHRCMTGQHTFALCYHICSALHIVGCSDSGVRGPCSYWHRRTRKNEVILLGCSDLVMC